MVSPDVFDRNAHLDPEYLQAPDGSFNYLINVPEAQIGTPYTRHFLRIGRWQDDPSLLGVDLKVRDRAGIGFTKYKFGINRDDTVFNFQATQFSGVRVEVDEAKEPLPASATIFAQAMSEIDRAKSLAARRAR